MALAPHPKNARPTRILIGLLVLVSLAAWCPTWLTPFANADEQTKRTDTVRCANLTYGNGQSSRCFADHFLADARKETTIWTDVQFSDVRLESGKLFEFPFAVMSGEGSFSFTPDQAENLRHYLRAGGFLVASSGCSSPQWSKSFVSEFAKTFPGAELVSLDMSHPIFHTVYDIERIKTKKRHVQAELKAMIIDGRVSLIFSPEGLNDTTNAGGECCCCGGNEILNARQINVNLLAYALTH